MIKAAKSNALVHHPAYAKILHQYNEDLKRDGKVNNKQFFERVIAPEMPNYPMSSWYRFLKRFKLEHGIVEAVLHDGAPRTIDDEAQTPVASTMRSNVIATAEMIQRILNISADAAQKIMDDPSLLTQKERVELGLKAMKAQDSRIHAIGKVREDNREQERFDRAFDGAAFG